MSNEIIKIGKAAKWRGTYDDNLTYYEENQVTMYGCVFSCKAEKVSGKPPVVVSNVETGSVVLSNTDIWDCIVNAIDFYNRGLIGVPLDTSPLEGSTNGITSGATYGAIKKVKDQIEATNKTLTREYAKTICLTEAQYAELEAKGEIDDNTYYMIAEE